MPTPDFGPRHNFADQYGQVVTVDVDEGDAEVDLNWIEDGRYVNSALTPDQADTLAEQLRAAAAYARTRTPHPCPCISWMHLPCGHGLGDQALEGELLLLEILGVESSTSSWAMASLRADSIFSFWPRLSLRDSVGSETISSTREM